MPVMVLVCFRNRERGRAIARRFPGGGVAVETIDDAARLAAVRRFDVIIVDAFAGGTGVLALLAAKERLLAHAPVVLSVEKPSPGEIVCARAMGALGCVQREPAAIVAETTALLDDARRRAGDGAAALPRSRALH